MIGSDEKLVLPLDNPIQLFGELGSEIVPFTRPIASFLTASVFVKAMAVKVSQTSPIPNPKI